MKKRIAKLIKLWRQHLKMTLDDLADRLDSDKQYVWKLENARINMTLDYLDKVIRSFGCSHDEFLALLPPNNGNNG